MSSDVRTEVTDGTEQPTEAVILDTDRGQVVVLHNDDVMRDLRDHHPEFTEGSMVIVAYPAHLTAFFSYDNPKMLGVQVFVGDAIVKDAAGNWSVERAIPQGSNTPDVRA